MVVTAGQAVLSLISKSAVQTGIFISANSPINRKYLASGNCAEGIVLIFWVDGQNWETFWGPLKGNTVYALNISEMSRKVVRKRVHFCAKDVKAALKPDHCSSHHRSRRQTRVTPWKTAKNAGVAHHLSAHGRR